MEPVVDRLIGNCARMERDWSDLLGGLFDFWARNLDAAPYVVTDERGCIPCAGAESHVEESDEGRS